MTVEELAEKLSIVAKSIMTSTSYAFMEVVKVFSDFERDMRNITIVIEDSYRDAAMAFQELADVVRETWGRYESFEEFIEWEQLEKSMSPRQYGLSLIRRKGKDDYLASQGYIRPFQRNLPYQRRCYC